MPIITLDDTNRLSLPAELLDRLGLKPGSRLSIELDAAGHLVLTPGAGAGACPPPGIGQPQEPGNPHPVHQGGRAEARRSHCPARGHDGGGCPLPAPQPLRGPPRAPPDREAPRRRDLRLHRRGAVRRRRRHPRRQAVFRGDRGRRQRRHRPEVVPFQSRLHEEDLEPGPQRDLHRRGVPVRLAAGDPPSRRGLDRRRGRCCRGDGPRPVQLRPDRPGLPPDRGAAPEDHAQGDEGGGGPFRPVRGKPPAGRRWRPAMRWSRFPTPSTRPISPARGATWTQLNRGADPRPPHPRLRRTLLPGTGAGPEKARRHPGPRDLLPASPTSTRSRSRRCSPLP